MAENNRKAWEMARDIFENAEPVIGISRGMSAIPERYLHPAFDKLTTYMRGSYSCISLDRLVDMTVSAIPSE